MKSYGSKFYTSFLLFIGVILIEYIAIIFLNNGKFIFSLDDPYIHFSLAENIFNGHYGVNKEEFSAPSSSILWPFLIAPLTALNATWLYILLINLFFSIASFILIFIVCKDYIFEKHKSAFESYWYALAFYFVLIANLIGLIFVGMEHSFQVCCAILIFWGILHEKKHKKFHVLLALGLCLLPLLRYESIVLTAPALLYFFIIGYRKASFLCGLIITAVVLGFSFYLYSLGLNILPNSVMAKSSSAADYGLFAKLIINFSFNSILPFGWALIVLSVLNIRAAIKRPEVRFVSIFGIAGLLHLAAGKLWWYGRYETYLLVTLSLCLLYVYRDEALSWIRERNLKVLIPAVVALLPSLFIIFTTPVLSNAIYKQPYFLYKFVNQIYQKPVASHDIGLLTYQNDHYVLDIWGLASKEALDLRLSAADPKLWLDDLTAKHDVDLVWITKAWFKEVPESWTKVAIFSRNDIISNVAGAGDVDFYVTTNDASVIDAIKLDLSVFSTTLVAGATLEVLP